MVSKEEYDAVLKALKRERLSRKEAERFIEEKSAELYQLNNELKEVNQYLEKRIIQRTEDIEQSRQELLIAKKLAEEGTQAKSDFLSNMTHELRTPLNGVIGLTDIILDEDISDKVRELLLNVKFSANHLAEVINEILDFSKIEAGKVVFENIPFNLPTLLKDLSNNLSVTAKSRGLELLIDIDKNIPEIVKGDKVKLSQIINNLVGNALKFTKKGFVRISCKLDAVKSDPNTNFIYFEVKDTGIGIKKEHLESVFNSFTQSDSSIGRLYGGTGLGLTITKNFIELQGGEIGVKSRYGIGSTFYFYLPFEPVQKMSETPVPEKKEVFEPLNLKVLVADDMKINQMVVGQILQKWGVVVDLASNGMEALALLEKHQYDLVLMDMQMPGMSGCDVTEVIRTDKRFRSIKDIPIIAFTANAFESSKKKVFDAGMNGFVSKPLIPRELYKTLSKIKKQIL